MLTLPTLPAASTACARIVCEPDATDRLPAFQVNDRLPLVAESASDPSMYTESFFTLTLSDAETFTRTLPLTLAPFTGDRIVTVGACVSPAPGVPPLF